MKRGLLTPISQKQRRKNGRKSCLYELIKTIYVTSSRRKQYQEGIVQRTLLLQGKVHFKLTFKILSNNATKIFVDFFNDAICGKSNKFNP